MSTSNIRIKKVCKWCGKEFLSQKCTTRFCDKRCTEHAYKERKRQERVRQRLKYRNSLGKRQITHQPARPMVWWQRRDNLLRPVLSRELSQAIPPVTHRPMAARHRLPRLPPPHPLPRPLQTPLQDRGINRTIARISENFANFASIVTTNIWKMADIH